MKGRLFVVNEDTREMAETNMEVSIKIPKLPSKNKRSQWDKSIIDIMGDLFQVEMGDYIFLWEAVSKSNKKSKIYGVYRAISKPYYDYGEGEEYPFKLKVEHAYVFRKPIEEYTIINNPHMKNELWTIIGKKVAGKSRGSSPLTNQEMEFLVQSLIDVNEGQYEFIPPHKEIKVQNELTIDLSKEYERNIPDNLSQFDINKLYHKTGEAVHYEKSLELIMNYLFRERKKEIIGQLGITLDHVVWYANYLPYGIERSEIDYMVKESIDGMMINKIDVIELMKDNIDEDHVRRSLLYAKWVRDSIGKGNNIVRALLICGPDSKLKENQSKIKRLNECIRQEEQSSGINLDIYRYCIKNGKIEFIKMEREKSE